MMTSEQFRNEVAKQVTLRLADRLWFRGVCMDHVDEHYPNLTAATDTAEIDTMYYDAPNHGF